MMAADETWIFSSCKPPVLSGMPLDIKVEQTLTHAGVEVLRTESPAVKLRVQGPQLQLSPEDVAGVYPAPGSEDSPDEFLPHIGLTRRTLPWERELVVNGKHLPWLALLLLNETELRGGQLKPAAVLRDLTMEELRKADKETHDILKASGVGATTHLHTVFMAPAKLRALLPKAEEVELLCHMKRSRTVGRGEQDVAVVIGNRLPHAPERSAGKADLHTALLVSLENRSDLYRSAELEKRQQIAIVVLHQWTFRPSRGGDFEQVMRAIGVRPNGGVLRFGNVASAAPPGTAPLSGGFAALLDRSGYPTPPLDHNQASAHAAYRGPLHPFVPPARNEGFAVMAAPEELASDEAGTFSDYSHAAAYELGRLLALHDPAIRDDLDEITLKFKKIETPVAGANLPPALGIYDQVHNPNPLEHHWSMGPDVSLVKTNEQMFELAGRADPSGIAEQLGEPAQQVVLDHLMKLPAPTAPAAALVDISGVDAQTLDIRFADVKNAGSS